MADMYGWGDDEPLDLKGTIRIGINFLIGNDLSPYTVDEASVEIEEAINKRIRKKIEKFKKPIGSCDKDNNFTTNYPNMQYNKCVDDMLRLFG